MGGVGVRGCCRSGGDLPGGQDSPVPRLRGVWQGMADVHSVRRQGSRVCGQATCNQLSTANQLRTVDLKEEAEKNKVLDLQQMKVWLHIQYHVHYCSEVWG